MTSLFYQHRHCYGLAAELALRVQAGANELRQLVAFGLVRDDNDAPLRLTCVVRDNGGKPGIRVVVLMHLDRLWFPGELRLLLLFGLVREVERGALDHVHCKPMA